MADEAGGEEAEEAEEAEQGDVDVKHVEESIRLLIQALMEDIANEHNLRQATCTITEDTYWAEHIGGNDESTLRYGRVTLGVEHEVCDGDDHEDDNESDYEDDDFGMD